MADAPRINAKEVFDSSKYNAMSDMTKASNRETKNVETNRSHGGKNIYKYI